MARIDQTNPQAGPLRGGRGTILNHGDRLDGAALGDFDLGGDDLGDGADDLMYAGLIPKVNALDPQPK